MSTSTFARYDMSGVAPQNGATGSSTLTFEQVLPRLVAAYDRGVLVPFMGAGMSREAAPDWAGMIAELERIATGREPAKDERKPSAQELMRRANGALRELRRAGKPVPDAVRTAIYESGGKGGASTAPDQTEALAALPWPLVLTTNYDDWFARAYRAARKAEVERRTQLGDLVGTPADPLVVLGRSQGDCRRVLESLDNLDESILWALQGYLLSKPDVKSAGDTHLEHELVVGHEEYRRVTHTAEHFRRAFAEVFRRRTLLFVGASLADTYFLDLFGEVLELLGASAQPHFAFLSADSMVDDDFVRSRFNISVVRYGKYHELTSWLERLAGLVNGPRARPTGWAFSMKQPAGYSGAATVEDVVIRHDPLPRLAAKECLVVSAGLQGSRPYLSDPIAKAVRMINGAFADAYKQKELVDVGPHGGKPRVLGYTPPGAHEPTPVLAVVPWSDQHSRNLRYIGDGFRDALQWAAHNGFTRVRAQMIGAGVGGHFHPRFSLVEMLRAYRYFRQSQPDSTLGLSIHVVNEAALFELTSGRLDPLELLLADDLRFRVEVCDQRGMPERETVFMSDESSVSELLARFAIPVEQWNVEILPALQPDLRTRSVGSVAGMTLRDIGVLPGSLLRFSPAAGA